MDFLDAVRQAVEDCGRTRYTVSQETGIDQAALCRFVHGECGLRHDTLLALADYLGLEIVARPKQAKERSGRGKQRKGS